MRHGGGRRRRPAGPRRWRTVELVVERSCLPSPLKSPIATESGALPPLLKLVAAPKLPPRGAQQHRDVVRALVGDGEVGIAIAVEVTDCDRARVAADRVGRGGAEAAASGAQRHRDGVRALVGEGEVGKAIGVEIADREPRRDSLRPRRTASRPAARSWPPPQARPRSAVRPFPPRARAPPAERGARAARAW